MPFPAASSLGKITAISPKVETASRTHQVRATLPNRPEASARHVRHRRARDRRLGGW
jgi:hypothetical protein